MAEVLTAVAETEPSREWTPTEIEEAKVSWRAEVERRVIEGDIRDWPLRAMAEGVVQVIGATRSAMGEIRQHARAG